MKLIPFWLWPFSWGTRGKTREILKAEYELEGEQLEKKLAEINISDETERQLTLLKIDRKYNKIDKEKYDYEYARLKYSDGHKGSLAKLELDRKYNKITEMEYEKAKFSLEGKPWVGVIGSEYRPEEGVSGFSFELDWNDAFIQLCIKNGYGFEGATEEQIVEQWFDDIATNEFYKEMMKNEEDYFDSNIYNQTIRTPFSRTTHERLDKTKSKHS